MISIDILREYKASLEEKIASIYYELNESTIGNSYIFKDSIKKLGKYHRRLEIVNAILDKLDNNNKLVK